MEFMVVSDDWVLSGGDSQKKWLVCAKANHFFWFCGSGELWIDLDLIDLSWLTHYH